MELNWTVCESGRLQRQKVKAMTGRYFEYELIQYKNVPISLRTLYCGVNDRPVRLKAGHFWKDRSFWHDRPLQEPLLFQA